MRIEPNPFETAPPLAPAVEAVIAPGVFEESVERYGLHLARQEMDIPEVRANRDAICLTAAKILVDPMYGIQPSLFDDETRSLMFTAIAYNYATTYSLEDDEAAYQAELYLVCALKLLANKHSDSRMFTMYDDEDVLLANKEVERFAHPELSTRLTDAIKQGLASDVLRKFGPQSDNQQPFNVQVLGLDTDAWNFLGMIPTPDGIAYARGLMEQAELFRDQVGFKPGAAWVHNADVSTLYVMMPLAEKLLYPELVADQIIYGPDEVADDLAVLEHELAHVKFKLGLNRQLFFGMSFEELKAESFSGNRHGYQDTKRAISSIESITGFDIHDALATEALSGSVAGFYTKVANGIGLQSLLDLTLTPPKDYHDRTIPVHKHLIKQIGGYEGIIERLKAQRATGGSQ